MRSSDRGASGATAPFAPAAVLFALSGAGALVIETTWMRWFRELLGASAPAASATLVAFLLGQALGAAIAARLAERLRRPLRAYAALEASAGIWALAVPFLLDAGGWLVTGVYDDLRERPATLNALRFGLALLATLPAAACFGATLPVLGRAVVGERAALGRRGAGLYGANLVGAAGGAALAGLGLPEHLGVRGTHALGVALLLGAAAGGLLLSAAMRARGPDPRRAPAAAPSAIAGALPRALLALAALSGFGSFAAQVLLVQAFGLVLDQSVYAFASVLVGVLLALALGAIATALAERRGTLDPRTLVAFALAATAIALAAFPALLASATDGLQVLRSERPWPDYAWRAFALAARTAGPALLPAGLLLPAAFALAARTTAAPEGAARILGRLAAANTLGALAGALTAPYLLLPWLGLWGALLAVAGLYATAALFVPQPAAPLRLARDLALGIGWIGVLVSGNPLSQPVVRVAPDERLLVVETSAAGVVSVVERSGELLLQTDNHYVLGGSAERIHEERQAHLPLLLRPGARRVAYVGAATGISAGAALAHPLERLTVVELIPAVARLAARTFGPYNRGVYTDTRTEVVLDDGRNFLRSTAQRFDLVVADLFVPWQAGTGALWTVEHFAAVRERLRADGVFCQWLPLYQLTEPEFVTLAATFLAVFPDAALFRGDFYGRFPIAALVGHAGAPASEEAVAEATRRLAASGERDRWVTHPLGPWSLYAGPLTPLASSFTDVPRNTDDHPRLEFSSARSRALRARGAAPSFTDLRLQAFVSRLRAAAERYGDPLYPELSPAARRAVDGGYALQAAGALFVAGRHEESAERLAEAWRLLPPELVAGMPADPSAAEVWRDGDG